MRGYWRDPERTAEALSPDGWLLSGDYARLDPAGNIVLAGRTSEMYIRGGYNVYPIEVERVLEEHPGVASAAVVGRTAPTIGEIGVAFVVPSDPASPPDLASLRTWVRDRLADYKAPDELLIIDAIPLTPMMKVDKPALKARLETARPDLAR
jgi:acyl-CoA synthetase (AMP-forming)/AMP-acid ligase II